MRLYEKGVREYYPLIYDLSIQDYEKLSASHINADLQKIRDDLETIEVNAKKAVKEIKPFDIKIFEQNFIKNHPLFKQKKKKIVEEENAFEFDFTPYEKRFRILKEVPLSTDHISATYKKVILGLIEEKRIGLALTTDGKLVGQYESMYQAGKVNGFNGRAIAAVASDKKGYLFKGFVWQLSKRKTLKRDTLPLKEEKDIINRSLMKKLAIKRTPKSLPAILDLSVKTRPDERWKDIPGYEGLYMVSSQGRVKALKKVSDGKQHKWYPERIKQLTVEVTEEPSGKIKTTTPLVTLCKDHNKKTVQVARWVYFLFVDSFNIKDATLRVYYKDGDNRNIDSGNLELKNAAWSINRMHRLHV
ncbi:hypothetical protein A8C56_10045 [Niabella ginsenosidivorans]|uniref:NUMOD4 domain-containing protein n=1 Tax=Niabella ginsenosidivorans TaxID=1176587 RepID=A0A1A9I3M0_9BACT|nr:NUMOD4 domain-containing protein [Niabella ginsenosidivorans]ANH81281.1 hypothetical protein A8C56_10045 [Niabella ginsenosidivorans]